MSGRPTFYAGGAMRPVVVHLPVQIIEWLADKKEATGIGRSQQIRDMLEAEREREEKKRRGVTGCE